MNRISCFLCRNRRDKEGLPEFCSEHLLPVDWCRKACKCCHIASPFGEIIIQSKKKSI